jgi:hypothetical protein
MMILHPPTPAASSGCSGSDSWPVAAWIGMGTRYSPSDVSGATKRDRMSLLQKLFLHYKCAENVMIHGISYQASFSNGSPTPLALSIVIAIVHSISRGDVDRFPECFQSP